MANDRRRALAAAALGALLALGCGLVKDERGGGMASAPMAAKRGGGAFQASRAEASAQAPGVERQLIRRASMRIETSDVRAASARAEAATVTGGGWVESSNTDVENETFTLVIRIPDEGLESFLDELAELGSVQERSIHAQDVTEEMLDSETRLANLVATRERLRELLGKTKDVKDVVAVETELSRIQGEIESYEARLKFLKRQVAMSTVVVTIERGTVLGPLGWVSWGVWWAVSKLFVIR